MDCNVGDFVEYNVGVLRPVIYLGVVMSATDYRDYRMYFILRVDRAPYADQRVRDTWIVSNRGNWRNLGSEDRCTVLAAAQDRIRQHQEGISAAKSDLEDREYAKQCFMEKFDVQVAPACMSEQALEQPRTLTLEEL